MAFNSLKQHREKTERFIHSTKTCKSWRFSSLYWLVMRKAQFVIFWLDKPLRKSSRGMLTVFFTFEGAPERIYTQCVFVLSLHQTEGLYWLCHQRQAADEIHAGEQAVLPVPDVEVCGVAPIWVRHHDFNRPQHRGADDEGQWLQSANPGSVRL